VAGKLESGTLGSGTLGEPLAVIVEPEDVAPHASVTAEFPPDKLAIRIDSPYGGSARWAEDEGSPDNVLSDIEFSDEIPGGYKEASGTLARNPRDDYRDLDSYSDINIYQPGVESVWQGSLDKGPKVTGDQVSISPAALGYQYILEDDNAAQVGFISSDLGKWGDPSSERRRILASENVRPNGTIGVGFRDAGAALAGILFIYERLAKGYMGGEKWFYGDGIDIGKLLYNFTGTGFDEAWTDLAALCVDDLYSGASAFIQSLDYNGVTTPEQVIDAFSSGYGYKYAIFSTWRNQGEAEIDPYGGIHSWDVPKVLGKHGIAPVGVWPNVGLPVKPMIEYLIKHFAQPLTIDPDFIDDDGYAVADAWYGEPSPLSTILNEITKLGLYDWFVYFGKRLEYRKPGTYGRFWKAYTAPSDLNELGEDSQRLWRKITVRYQDADGSTRLIGPPGSGNRIESTELEITDPEHPAVKAGRTRRDLLDLQGIHTSETALSVGVRFLEEANLLNRSGSATLSGYVLDDYGLWRPAAQVKSGDYVSFVDAADTSYRKIVGKQYQHASRASAIDLDAPPSGLEALLERLQAGLIEAGVN
jgi:hypothetical protein